MGRIGYFSIRGYWRSPLAVFAIVVVAAVAMGGRQKLGIGLGAGVAYSLIIALILSMGAAQKQSVLEVMHEVDSSLQLVNLWTIAMTFGGTPVLR
jgi:anti-sigma-K factor RskA